MGEKPGNSRLFAEQGKWVILPLYSTLFPFVAIPWLYEILINIVRPAIVFSPIVF